MMIVEIINHWCHTETDSENRQTDRQTSANCCLSATKTFGKPPDNQTHQNKSRQSKGNKTLQAGILTDRQIDLRITPSQVHNRTIRVDKPKKTK